MLMLFFPYIIPSFFAFIMRFTFCCPFTQLISILLFWKILLLPFCGFRDSEGLVVSLHEVGSVNKAYCCGKKLFAIKRNRMIMQTAKRGVTSGVICALLCRKINQSNTLLPVWRYVKGSILEWISNCRAKGVTREIEGVLSFTKTVHFLHPIQFGI